MSARSENGIRAGNLTIRLVQGRNIKLIISRNDRKELPHLTISWQNPSKEIDVHLKKRTPGGHEHHQPIATIPEYDFARVLESFGSELLRVIALSIDKVRKVRPGWLARNRYVLLYLPDDVQELLIQRLAPKQRRHGKWTHIVNKDVLENMEHLQEINNSIYHPAMLHELAALGYSGPVFAECIGSKYKHRLMSLQLVNKSNGRCCWVRTDKLARELMNMSEGFIVSSLKQLLPNDSWLMVHNELRFDEIGFKS